MKETKHLRHFFVLSILLLSATVAHAELLNTDFSNGFAHWTAEVMEYDIAQNSINVNSGDIASLYSENFITNGGTGVELSTFSDGNFDYYGITLSQDFRFISLTTGTSLELSVDVTNGATSDQDTVVAGIFDASNNDLLVDLSLGGVFNVTNLIGYDLFIQFSIIDDDLSLLDAQLPFDFLKIENLSVQECNTLVPEPSSIVLMLLGVLGILLGHRTKVQNR